MFPLSTRILVIDDMMTMRKIVMKSLRDIGYNDLVEATDGEKGWGIIKTSKTPIQLVISDWNMPNCTGIELLKAVRADAVVSSLPFVLLTAEGDAHQVKEAVVAGVTNYILKPFTVDILRQKLEQAYKKAFGATPKT